MKNLVDFVPVYEFRPLPEMLNGIYRYANGEWIVDDGEHDIAFALLQKSMALGFDVPSRENIIWSWAKNNQWWDHISTHPGGNAWHYMLREDEKDWGDCWSKYEHLNFKAKENAMKFVVSKNRSACGSGPEFHINDPYIAQGLVREKETQKIVEFPDILDCMYCGEIDWRKEEEHLIGD